MNTTILAHTPLANRLARLLGPGFALLIILMAGLAAHAVWHIRDLEQRMHEIVDVHNRKIQFATDLLEAAYNRHSALIYQTLAKDPFERDANFQSYIKWGYHVGKARNDLKAMPLNAFERNNLSQQDRLVARVIVAQEAISDLAARGQMAEAQAMTAEVLRPINLQFTETIEALRHHERDHVHDALIETEQASEQAIRVHIALGVVLLLLAVVIARTTLRLLARHAHTLDAHVSALEEAYDLIEHEATHDPLTGLANRALFYKRVQGAIAHAEQEGFKVGVMYLDLDHFKPINDLYGHAAGDALLRIVASRLKGVVRVSDTVARLGGDEFALVLQGMDGVDMRDALRIKLQDTIAQPADLDGVSVTPGCSVGCAVYPDEGTNLDALIKIADQRMYANKQARKAAEA